MDFKDKTVLITGASSGIGSVTAAEFARSGANIALVARRKEKLDQVEDGLGEFHVSTLACQCDVSKRDQVEQMSKEVLEKFGSVDVLVNNAGIIAFGSISDLSIDEICSQMETNYFGMVYCIKNFLPSMLKKTSAHIVNVASVGASVSMPGIASYCASKFAMLGFSEGLKHELGGTGVGVTVVSPIGVRTDFIPSLNTKAQSRYSSVSAKTVARAILRAANSSRLEITVPSAARAAIWMKNTFPYVVNPLAAKSFKKQLKTMMQND